MSFAHYSSLLRTEGSVPTRGVSVRTSLTIEQIEDDAHSPNDPHTRTSRRNSDAGDGKYSDIKHKYFSRLKLGAPEAGRVKPIIVSREQEVTLNGDEPHDDGWHPHVPPGETVYGSSSDIKSLQPFSASFTHHSMPQPVPYNFSNNSPPIAIPVKEQLVKRGVEVSGRVSRKNSTVIPTSLPFSPPKDSVPPSALAAQLANLDIGSGVIDSTDVDSLPLSRNATSSAAPEPISSPYSPLTSPSPSVYSRRLGGQQVPTAYSGYGEPTGMMDSGLPLDYSARLTDMLAQSTASNTPSTATSAQSRGVRTHSSPSAMFRGGLPTHPTAPLQHSSHVRMNERDRDRDVDLFDFEPDQGNEYFEEPVPVKPTRNFEDYFRS